MENSNENTNNTQQQTNEEIRDTTVDETKIGETSQTDNIDETQQPKKKESDTIIIEEEESEAPKKSIDMKEILNKIGTFLREWKYLLRILIWIAIATTGVMTRLIIKTVFDVQNLNTRSNELYNIKNYNTSILNTNNYTKNKISDFKTIDDVIEYNLSVKDEDTEFVQYLADIQSPYDNFLQYLLLPSLNIWKDTYLWDIDDSIIWEKYLEKNPYDDIALLDKWSNFIKDVWINNEYNEINTIEIWNITDEWNYFYIPIKISYTAPSYRGFLLLVEKLSVTSNKKNLSLINELTYNLREKIKEKKPWEVITLQESHEGFSEDKAIGYSLYSRIKWDSEYTLIDDNIIDEAIREIAICQSESTEYCYYKFRNKYRNLPSLAYTIWLNGSWSKTEMLRTFFQELPQVIKVVNFTYDWEGEVKKDMTNTNKKQYKWTIDLKIYWKWLNDNEVVEIQQLLWEKCLWVNLTPEVALEQISSKIANIWSDKNIDTYSANMLLELETLIKDIKDNFRNLNNYKKIVKTFEIYRMLNEWDICNL